MQSLFKKKNIAQLCGKTMAAVFLDLNSKFLNRFYLVKSLKHYILIIHMTNHKNVQLKIKKKKTLKGAREKIH